MKESEKSLSLKVESSLTKEVAESWRLNFLDFLNPENWKNRNPRSYDIAKLSLYAIYKYARAGGVGEILTKKDIDSLRIVFKSKDDIELQFNYFVSLFDKAANYKSNKLAPDNVEYRQLTTAFFQSMGKSTFDSMDKLNELFQQGLVVMSMIDDFFTNLVHFCPQEWDLCPNSYNTTPAVMAYTVMKNPSLLDSGED